MIRILKLYPTWYKSYLILYASWHSTSFRDLQRKAVDNDTQIHAGFSPSTSFPGDNPYVQSPIKSTTPQLIPTRSSRCIPPIASLNRYTHPATPATAIPKYTCRLNQAESQRLSNHHQSTCLLQAAGTIYLHELRTARNLPQRPHPEKNKRAHCRLASRHSP